MSPLLVVGGSVAGVRVATAVREAGFSGSVTVLDREAGLPYDKPGLSKRSLADGGLPAELPGHITFDQIDVDHVPGAEATRLDLTGGTVETNLGPGALRPPGDRDRLAAARACAAGRALARWPNPRYGREMRLEHWTSAREQATYAARPLADETSVPDSGCALLPYVWSDQYAHRLQLLGDRTSRRPTWSPCPVSIPAG